MDKQSKNNAKEALNNLKMEIATEMGYHYNMKSDKIEGLNSDETLIGHTENVLAGEQVGGQMTKNLVEKGLESLSNPYNSKI